MADVAARSLDDVMDRFARGDDGAFDDVYRLAAPRIRAFLVRLSSDLALADDLTHDAFLRVHRARGSFVEGAAAVPWVLAIARNTFRDHVRREHVRSAYRATATETGDEPSSYQGVDRAAIARQTLEKAQQVLMGLPVRQREAFVLLRFEGLDLDAVASVLGTTPAAVKILAHRACGAIRATLDRQDMAREPRLGRRRQGER